MLQGCCKDAAQMLQGSCKEATMMLQGCCKDAAMMLQKHWRGRLEKRKIRFDFLYQRYNKREEEKGDQASQSEPE